MNVVLCLLSFTPYIPHQEGITCPSHMRLRETKEFAERYIPENMEHCNQRRYQKHNFDHVISLLKIFQDSHYP